MSNRPLVMLGAALVIAGLAVLVSVLTQNGGSDAVAGPGAIAPSPDEGAPSYAWPILAGLTVAVGAACVMIGMKNWQRS
jgi:hypothetical protein